MNLFFLFTPEFLCVLWIVCSFSCCQYVCEVCLWLSARSKGHNGETGERQWTERGTATVPKAIPVQTDTILKLANGLQSVACCPICGPLPPGDIPTHPVMGHHCVSWAAGWGFGGWAGLGVVVVGGGTADLPTVLKWNGSSLIYLQHVLHSSHNTVNYLHGQGFFLRQGETGERKGHKTCDLDDI